MEPAEQDIDGAVLVLNHPAPTDDGHNGRQDPGNDQQDAEQATQGEAFDEEEGQAQAQQITAHDAEDGTLLQIVHVSILFHLSIFNCCIIKTHHFRRSALENVF